MKNCIECNEPLDEDAKFCSECRAKQPEKVIEPEEVKPVKKTAKPKPKTVPEKKPAAEKPKKPKKTGPTYQEKKMQIYNMTLQNYCDDRDCGCSNCMQFAMQAASPKNSMELSDCPYIDEDDAEEFNNSFGGNDDGDETATTPKNIGGLFGWLENYRHIR